MSTRTEALTEEFTLWLDRYSPRRALLQNQRAQAAEVNALMRVVLKMAPSSNYLEWLEGVTTQLDYQMKTTAWPTVSEVGSACSNINKTRASGGPKTQIETDSVAVAAKRMNAGDPVGDGYLYGRRAVALERSGRVSTETMRQYRSALYFSMKDLLGEDVARTREADLIDRHEAAKTLDDNAQLQRDVQPPSPKMMERREWDGAA